MGVGGDNDYDNRNNLNANDQLNNNGLARRMEHDRHGRRLSHVPMKTYNDLWNRLASFENLEAAYEKVRKHKQGNPRIREFHEHWRYHLYALQHELRTKTYRPRPLRRFVLRDPKTRVISKSDVRDRVIHHALINILQPIFEPTFIHDSHASQKGKGTLSALRRFDTFAKKIGRNHTRKVFVLKCDIQHYFGTVDHQVLLQIIARRVTDEGVLWLTQVILNHHRTATPGKGMPLGNWTSQFFANIYLNELDQHIKHTLKTAHYLRYVDDFVILHHDPITLAEWHTAIDEYLRKSLALHLHPDKCHVIPLARGVPFLGFRIFPHHKIPQRRNLRAIKNRIIARIAEYQAGHQDAQSVLGTLAGWNGYALHANTYRKRERLRHELECQLSALADKHRNKEREHRTHHAPF